MSSEQIALDTQKSLEQAVCISRMSRIGYPESRKIDKEPTTNSGTDLQLHIGIECGGLGAVENCFLNSCTASQQQCVELSLSNVSNWMGDHQRKHCAQLPGEARKLEEY